MIFHPILMNKGKTVQNKASQGGARETHNRGSCIMSNRHPCMSLRQECFNGNSDMQYNIADSTESI